MTRLGSPTGAVAERLRVIASPAARAAAAPAIERRDPSSPQRPRDAQPCSPPRINNFDAIRLAAAYQVLAVHGLEHFHLDTAPGYHFVWRLLRHVPGVIVFFTVSGFLIFWSFDRSPDLRRYRGNRLARIYPAMWAAFIVSALMLVVHGYIRRTNVTSTPILAWIVGQVSFAQFYTPEIFRGYGIGTPNGALWTIVVELQFYAVVPAFLRLAGSLVRRRNALLAILAAASIVVNVWARSLDPMSLQRKLIGVTVFPYLIYFIIGVAAYVNWDTVHRFFVGTGARLALVFVAYAAFVGEYLGLYQTSYWPNFFGFVEHLLLGALTIAVAFTARSTADRVLRGNDISYGLYLIHCIVINVLVQHHINGGTALLMLTTMSTLYAVLSWVTIERPVLRRRRGLERRRQPSPMY